MRTLTVVLGVVAQQRSHRARGAQLPPELKARAQAEMKASFELKSKQATEWQGPQGKTVACVSSRRIAVVVQVHQH